MKGRVLRHTKLHVLPATGEMVPVSADTPGMQLKVAVDLGLSYLPMWETQMLFWAPGFSLVLPLTLWRFGE